ncbi:hypothetical protein [Actinoplanes sp. NPDC020271]|uniref:hypothetical protein n=1 Tax=Actinoplanes sp. NPDC020271 TaxID=3363896 RepID=UPI00378C29A1
MSKLGDEVARDLARRGVEVEQDRVEKILLTAGVSSIASRGVPARLRVRRLHVTGTKRYLEKQDVDTDEPNVEMKTEPINLDWRPGDGVNGVGSERNLRGKSSVLHFTMWALTGRSHLQADVLLWVDHVLAEFHVDGVPLFVEFDVRDGVPQGTVAQKVPSGRAVLGSFSSHAEFESLMGSVMLDRLRLDVISVFSKGVETEHAWPSYAAALTVHADKLDPIVGNENTLKTRILQMFVGTSWAAVDAQAATALNGLNFERASIAETRQTVVSATTSALGQARERATAARAALDGIDPTAPDVDAIFTLAAAASARAREAHDLSLQLMTANTALSEAKSQLRTEEIRRQAAAEDAVARRLFNGMAPTACPRCATAVTAERYAAEATDHECSMCKSGLELADQAKVNVSVSKASPEGASTALGLAEEDEEDEEAVDPVDALRAAVREARTGISQLEDRFRTADRSRVEAEAAAQKARSSMDIARSRLQAELELARAESAVEALQAASLPQPSTAVETEEPLVLGTASRLTKKWVQVDQGPLLEAVSATIARLARKFGFSAVTAVRLKGNGNMDVYKGGAVTGYSDLVNGEKLRIKLAAAIALIEIGHTHGVGRHPGLLFVDSPAAEEIPEDDLRTMLQAWTAVAKETDLQIVVATTHARMLSEVLPAENLLIATGSDFVW